MNAPQGKTSLRHHPRFKLGLKISAALAVALLAVWWFAFRPFVSTDDARVATTLIRVAPEAVGGRVIRVAVTEGVRVKKGDVLVELNHQIPDAQLQRAKAKALLAERDLHRISELVAQRGLAPKDLDLAKANSDSAQADLRLAQTAFDNTTIKSPVDGIVIQKVAEEGNILEPGQVAVAVSDVDHAWIAANIEETSVGPVKVGQPVTVVIDEGGTLTGKVQEVRAAVASQFALIPSDSGSGNFTKVVQRIPIKIELDPHPDQTLRAGQSVEIKIRVH